MLDKLKGFTRKLSINSDILSSMNEGVCLFDPADKKLIYANPRMLRIMNIKKRTPSEVSSISSEADIYPEMPENIFTEEIMSQELWNGEIELSSTDGNIMNFNVITKRTSYSGYPCLILAVFRDVTDFKKTLSLLNESENNFYELFNNMTNGITIYRPVELGFDFIVEDLNKASCIKLRKSRELLINTLASVMQRNSNYIAFTDNLRSVYESGKPLVVNPMLYTDGNIRMWIRQYIYKLTSGKLVVLTDDITSLMVNEK